MYISALKGIFGVSFVFKEVISIMLTHFARKLKTFKLKFDKDISFQVYRELKDDLTSFNKVLLCKPDKN